MIKKTAFWSGIVGVMLFTFTTVIAGFLNPDYSHFSQFISELYADEAPNADTIRYYFYLPSGVLFLLFALSSNASLPKSNLKTIGFLGIGLGYGIGTIICSIFNCDIGCNPKFINPSLSQIIHNLMGMITYLIVPFSILAIGIASKKWNNANKLSYLSFIIFGVSFVFVLILNISLESPLVGLIQRIVEGSILIWIVFCSFQINKNIFNNS